MSYASISSNDKAKGYIVDAIKEYEKSLEKIKIENDNKKSDDLIKEIEDTIGYLYGLISNINSVNGKISSALEEKARKEEAERARQKNESHNRLEQ